MVWRGFTRCGNWLVVRADGCGAVGGAGLSAALGNAGRAAFRNRGCPGGERVGSGTGALRTSDIGGARFRAGFQPMRGDRRERKAMLCQCQKRRCGKRGGSQRLRTATLDRKSVVEGKRLAVRLDLGGRRRIKK